MARSKVQESSKPRRGRPPKGGLKTVRASAKRGGKGGKGCGGGRGR